MHLLYLFFNFGLEQIRDGLSLFLTVQTFNGLTVTRLDGLNHLLAAAGLQQFLDRTFFSLFLSFFDQISEGERRRRRGRRGNSCFDDIIGSGQCRTWLGGWGSI